MSTSTEATVNQVNDNMRKLDSDVGLFACYWGEPAGGCWECWRILPCCDSIEKGLYCFACAFFCPLCTAAKCYASSMDQDCAIINHCLYMCFCSPCAMTCLRHNMRFKNSIGDTRELPGWLGDFLMIWCCGLCTVCQMYRNVPTDYWDWLGSLGSTQVFIEPCKLCLQ